MRVLPQQLSVRWQFCLLIAGVLVASLTLLGTLAFWQSKAVVAQLAENELQNELERSVQVLRSVLIDTRADCLTTIDFPPIPGLMRCWDNGGIDPDPRQSGSTTAIWISRLGDIVSAQMQRHQERLACAVYDADGNLVMRVDHDGSLVSDLGAANETVRHESFFQLALQLPRNQVHFSPMRYLEGQKTLFASTPFFDAEGSVRGVFSITVDGGQLLQLTADAMQRGSRAGHRWLDVVDEEGMYLLCGEEPQREFKSDSKFARHYPVRAGEMETKEFGEARYISAAERPDETALFGAFQKVYYDPDMDRHRYWCLAPSFDAASILEPSRTLAGHFLAVGLVVLLAASLTAFAASGPLTASLQRLTKTAHSIAAGKLDTEIPRGGHSKEIRALSASLRSMTAGLRKMLDRSVAEESHTKAILDSTADSIVTMDDKGRILACNAATEKVFGWPCAELLGQSAARLAEALYDESAQYSERELARGESRRLGQESEVEGRRADGSHFPLSLRVTEMNYAGQLRFIATMQDITERRKAEQQREDLFRAIRDAVLRLATANRQIVATTHEQASGTTQQAAAVSQTVATVNEVAETASQAAQRAQTVAMSARQADEVGTAGRKAVEDTVSAMDEVRRQVESLAENILLLAEKAQAIGDIIATVREFAEQTNVLALNASVEAARAGDQGKGFAVVASEVKLLAERSKKATAEVRDILEQIQEATNHAVIATEHGTRSVSVANQIVAEAGETIKTLSQTLAQSARAATQISASANQQAAGVNQLHEGIRNIDKVTKQNMAAIRQIEEAAHNLNALSAELASLTAES